MYIYFIFILTYHIWVIYKYTTSNVHICAVWVITAFKSNYEDTAAAENKKRLWNCIFGGKEHKFWYQVYVIVSEKLPHHIINGHFANIINVFRSLAHLFL